MNSRTTSFKYLLLIHVVLLAIAFGMKLLQPGSFMLTVDYDGMKNYFNYYYFAAIQDGGSIFDYYGMGYPFGDHILYMDASTLLAVMARYMVPDSFDIAFYNLFFLLNIVLGPLLAFRIAQKLGFTEWISIVFALFIVWANPMGLRLGEWSNLSLSIFYLAAFYLVIRVYERADETYSTKDLQIAFAIAALIFCASFIHLYYLLILAFFFGAALFFTIFSKNKIKFLLFNAALGISLVLVYLIVKGTDPYLALRPQEGMGFYDPMFSAKPQDYFTRYSFLKLPIGYLKPWGKFTPQFLGSYFPFFLFVALLSLLASIKKIQIAKLIKRQNLVYIAIFAGTALCFFTSFGIRIIFSEETSFSNYLNPLFVLDNVVEPLKHFRYQSRFGHVAFVGITILAFKLISKEFYIHDILNRVRTLKYVLSVIIVLFVSSDVLSHVWDFSKRYKHQNIFSETYLEEALPDLSMYAFDAILPVPYYNVGSETWGYIIDDNNKWSRESYMMAIKYGKPLMSKKSSRSPVEHAQKLLSFIGGEDQGEIYEVLHGKTILVCVTDKYGTVPGAGKPAEDYVSNQFITIEKWEKQLVSEKNGVQYYLVSF